LAKLLRARIDGPNKLGELLSRKSPVLAPGAYDALTARLIEATGFEAVYMTGYGTAASRIGRPDVGLLTMSEMVENARHIVEAVDVPVIADADTGYGNPVTVIRTVREYERAGVAGIHIEDQVWPKKCGHMEGKMVIPAEDMVQKIRAAAAAKQSKNFLIIARTDARAVEGLDAALKRGHLYRDAGADVLFIEAPQSDAEIVTISKEFKNTPLLYNWAEGGKTPPLPLPRIAELGFRIVIFPVSTLLIATRAIREALIKLKDEGTPISLMNQMTTFGDFVDFIGLPEIRELEKQFTSKGVNVTR
jgi:2-methylisocitrate lyase-like PEP mutase family enzyme